jgi:glycerol-3-phosphate dehydrogenase
MGSVAGSNSPRRVRLVKGSHIITRKFWGGPQAYLFQNTDKRVIFVNPYEGDMALIGTTDIPYQGRVEDIAISEGEISYLLAAVNRYSKVQLTTADVISTFSGVRPLYDDKAANPSAVTRDYVFDVEGTPPLLSIFGGKITTYRKLSEHALQRLKDFFPQMGGEWTAKATLPGGDMPGGNFNSYLEDLRRRYHWLPEDLAHRYARLYGTRAEKLIGNAGAMTDLGRLFGGGFTEAEANYLRTEEWAQSAEDMLFRRTKCGLHMSAAEREAVARAC